VSYDHRTFERLTYFDARARFLAGEDTPSAYLERCIGVIEACEPVVKAWASLRLEAARRDAEASAARYRAGRPLSTIDGMPIGIKDLIATRDLPTALGIVGNEQAAGLDDSASVLALKDAGAIIVGKTTTAELGGGWPSPSTNPFDPGRTPGGSSSGSAAAVGAGMVPATLGTQVAGSILRPASFCGTVAIKPTMGAIHRGEGLELSHSCIGVLAGSLEDMWAVTAEVAARSGGDPGYPGLYGEPTTPAAARPRRLAVLEGPGWEATEPAARAAFLDILTAIATQDVQIVRRADDEALESFHEALPSAFATVGAIVTYENRTLLANLMARMPDKLSPAAHAQYERGRKLTVEHYRAALAAREELRLRHARLAEVCDAVISPSAPGVAPPLIDPNTASPAQLPTGNPIFNVIPSLTGAPALSLPLLTVQGLPLGVQFMGQWHEDQKLTGLGAWAMQALRTT